MSVTIKITNLSKNKLKKLNNKVPLIALLDVGEHSGYIPNLNDRLSLVIFLGVDGKTSANRVLTLSHTRAIYSFIKECKEKGHNKIYIQCREGKTRSYTLAEELSFYSKMGSLVLDGVKLTRDLSKSCYITGVLDHYLRHQLAKHTQKLVDGLEVNPGDKDE